MTIGCYMNCLKNIIQFGLWPTSQIIWERALFLLLLHFVTLTRSVGNNYILRQLLLCLFQYYYKYSNSLRTTKSNHISDSHL